MTGLNSGRYIHYRFMLANPPGDDPDVVTGRAGFSGSSQYPNHANTVVIRGNTRAAEIH